MSKCPYCEKRLSRVGTEVVASSTKGGARITLVYCGSCFKVLGALPHT